MNISCTTLCRYVFVVFRENARNPSCTYPVLIYRHRGQRGVIVLVWDVGELQPVQEGDGDRVEHKERGEGPAVKSLKSNMIKINVRTPAQSRGQKRI